LATEAWPAEETANAPCVLPLAMEKVCVSPTSGSVQVSVPKAVPAPAFSPTDSAAACSVGASFTLVTVMETVDSVARLRLSRASTRSW